jgi:SAM-dependent methyltransferase
LREIAAMQNAEQFEYWNGPEGQHWADREDRFDGMLGPFVEPLLDAAGIAPDDRVLDVGCGNGATSLAAARRAATGRVVGVDISGPMLTRARGRAAGEGIDNVEFVHADAQDHDFGVDAGTFDVMISRFGVMFFADPVAAFSNLASALRPGGRVAFLCWQGLFANEWVAVPAAAIIPIVGAPEAPPPDAPGPFSFADRDRVSGILADSGFTDVTFDDMHLPVVLGGGLPLDDAVAFLGEGGMGKRFLGDADEPTVARALAAVRDALVPYASSGGVRLDSAVWLVCAQR